MYQHQQYIRAGKYSIEDVLPYIVTVKDVLDLVYSKVKKKSPEYIQATERDYDGHMVKMTSQRYQLFAEKRTVCIECGLVGTHFWLEKNKWQEGDRYHFNLYGVRDGVEVMLTKDHIVPKSKGGKNTLSNYQTMCFDCNIEKADTQ